MNKRQENKLTMYEGLLTLLSSNGAKVSSVAGFDNAVKELSGIISDLKNKSSEVNSVSAGKTAEKHSAEDAMISTLLPVCSGLYVLGRKQNNAKIKEMANVTEGRLHAMRDTELASLGNTIADMAASYDKDIAAYGVTQDMIAGLKEKAQQYSAAIGGRESGVAERKGARSSMNELFDKADEILNEEIDRFMEIIRLSETEFYNKYSSARVVKDMGVRHRQHTTAAAKA